MSIATASSRTSTACGTLPGICITSPALTMVSRPSIRNRTTAAHHHAELFVGVRVRRHDAAFLQLEAADRHRIAGDEAARDGVVDLLAWNVCPSVMVHGFFFGGKSGRGSDVNPLRFGIWIFGSVA